MEAEQSNHLGILLVEEIIQSLWKQLWAEDGGGRYRLKKRMQIFCGLS